MGIRPRMSSIRSWSTPTGQKVESRSFEAMMNNPKDVARGTKWIQHEGRFEQFCYGYELCGSPIAE